MSGACTVRKMLVVVLVFLVVMLAIGIANRIEINNVRLIVEDIQLNGSVSFRNYLKDHDTRGAPAYAPPEQR